MIAENTLTILQYNVRKSRDTVMATLLRDPRIKDLDIIAIQEPWRNSFSETPKRLGTHGHVRRPAKGCFSFAAVTSASSKSPLLQCSPQFGRYGCSGTPSRPFTLRGLPFRFRTRRPFSCIPRMSCYGTERDGCVVVRRHGTGFLSIWPISVSPITIFRVLRRRPVALHGA